jgi:hypothetical protein
MADSDSRLHGSITDEDLQKQFPAAVSTVLRILDSWQLTDEEARAVLNIDEATFGKLKKDPTGVPEKLVLFERISYILGIRKGLETLFPSERGANLERPWVKLPNSSETFQGRKPLDLMSQADAEGLRAVRKWLDGWAWS